MAIMLAMAVSLLLLVGGFFIVGIGPNLGGGRVVREYARLLAATSPDLPAARKLADRFELHVRYRGPTGAWATDEALPSFEDVHRPGAGERPARDSPIRYAFVEAAPDGGEYLFVWEQGRRIHVLHDRLVWLLLVLVAGVVLFAHVVLNRLLRPLRSLQEGVDRLGRGELDFALPRPTRDEFGSLTAAFNEMVRRVGDMVRARDQLLLDVSHELRSPLTRMKVALALSPGGEKKREMANDVAEMEAMIGELLELERLRDGRAVHRVRGDLAPLLREVVGTVGAAAPGARLSLAVPALPVDIDEGRVRAVLRNVLENALKYSLPDSRAVEVTAAIEDGLAVVRFADDGPGIPTEDLPSLFEPFFRVDRSRSRRTGGYGLGLSLCKRVMEAHRGTISAANNPGRGATFTLRFPPPA
jgi:signal transduction histidine kinase